MHVIAKKQLRLFWEKRPDAKGQLEAWYAEAHHATWPKPSTVKANYPKASILGDNRVVFNICGNKYRLIVRVNYQSGTVFIRFIGTHKEYDAIDAETI